MWACGNAASNTLSHETHTTSSSRCREQGLLKKFRCCNNPPSVHVSDTSRRSRYDADMFVTFTGPVEGSGGGQREAVLWRENQLHRGTDLKTQEFNKFIEPENVTQQFRDKCGEKPHLSHLCPSFIQCRGQVT